MAGVAGRSVTRPERVLVVDDDPEVRALLRNLLERAGYAVDTAHGGRHALESFPDPRPDLLVLDLAMPQVDGWDVLEALQRRGRLPPVVLLCERGENPRRGRFPQCITACLFKPLRPDEFLGTCRRVMSLAARAEDFAQERRREPRRQILVEVALPPDERKPAVRGTLIDLSPGGFQIELGVSLAPGDTIRVVVSLPGVPPLELAGRVRWVRGLPGGFLVGGELRDADPEKALLVEALLGPTVPIDA